MIVKLIVETLAKQTTCVNKWIASMQISVFDVLSSACWPVKDFGLTSKGVQDPSFEACQRPIGFRRLAKTFRSLLFIAV